MNAPRNWLFRIKGIILSLQKNRTMKKISFLLPILFSIFLASCVVSDYHDSGYWRPVYIGPGVGLGTIIAVVLSWSRNKSILWAIIHGILGWLYVIYAILVPKR